MKKITHCSKCGVELPIALVSTQHPEHICEGMINDVCSKKVPVMFACMHEGEIETTSTIFENINPREYEVDNSEMVQYIVFHKKIKCPTCEAAIWNKE